jgi:glucose dehydrogenase
VAVIIWATAPTSGQSGAKTGEWTTYGGDLANTRYSPLDQISADNFNKLEVAWRFKTENLGPRPETQFESTPLMVRGVVYSTAGTRRAVVALDAATGETLWIHREVEGPRGDQAPRQLSGRGLAYWSDGREERIIYVTPGYRLLALDAKTGAPIPGFGKDGVVDLKLEAAKRLMDFAASRKANEIYAKFVSQVAIEGVAKPIPHYPAGVAASMIKNDLDWASENRDRILAEWTNRYGARK